MNQYDFYNEGVGFDSIREQQEAQGLNYTTTIEQGRGAVVTPTPGGNTPTAVETTYAELKSKRDNGELVPGTWYRITDYQCTTTQENTSAATHNFDIVVNAIDEHTLNENAFAATHEGDTYFSGCNLSAWELKYTLDNDKAKHSWAGENNGKGIVYYMKDEWNNECPYDFKNIMFKRYKVTHDENHANLSGLDERYMAFDTEDKPTGLDVDGDGFIFAYTFSSKDSELQITDFSIEGFSHDNTILPYGSALNNIVFYGTYNYGNRFGVDCYSNTFGNDCYYNTFGNECYGNTFGNYVRNNTFGNDCYYNTFGNDFVDNTFGNDVQNNTFENSVGYNTFGNECYSNTFGNFVQNNTFGNSVGSNTFGNNFGSNTFGNGVGSNTFGNECNGNTFGNYVQNNTFGNYVTSSVFENYIQNVKVGGGTQSSQLQYVKVLSGTKGASSSSKLTISFTAGKTSSQFAGLNSLGVLKYWTPADIL